MKSFDRFLCEETGEVKYFQSTSINSEVRTRVRCVPWPEGAPDPRDVPQAGEKVTITHHIGVYTVTYGIPVKDRLCGNWNLRVNQGLEYLNVVLSDITIYTEPEEERTYTEAEIHSAYNRTPAYTSNDLIKDLRNPE